jgi:hypothetical protein
VLLLPDLWVNHAYDPTLPCGTCGSGWSTTCGLWRRACFLGDKLKESAPKEQENNDEVRGEEPCNDTKDYEALVRIEL